MGFLLVDVPFLLSENKTFAANIQMFSDAVVYATKDFTKVKERV